MSYICLASSRTSVQSGDENFEGGLITALCVFRRYTITEGRNYLVERFALDFLWCP